MADEWTGQDIDGRYATLGVLGRGGMRIVPARRAAPAPVVRPPAAAPPEPRAPRPQVPRLAAAASAPDRSSAPETGEPAPPGCGLEGPDCARLCAADPRSARCLETVGTSDCQAWSRCVLGASCSGEPPRGEASCGDTFACERSCRDHIACGCSCLGKMAPAHALAMTGCRCVRCSCARTMPAVCSPDARRRSRHAMPVRSRSRTDLKGANAIRNC